MSRATNLLSGRLLAGNVIWSLAGAGLPLLVGLWAIPELIEGLGKERFGLLSIVWIGIGYFSLFDLGIGRALTKLIAERLGQGRVEELPELIRTGLRLMYLIGVAAAFAVIAIAPLLIEQGLQVPAALQSEGIWSFWILATVLPFVVSTAGLIGILQAHQRFRAITLVRLPLGVANFLGPVMVLPLTNSLVATTMVLALARIAAWLTYHLLCIPYQKAVNQQAVSQGLMARKPLIRQLLAFGGWITLSNLLSPIMVYFDRLFIGSILGLVAVTYYTTPYEIVTRLWIVPGAVADVLFPALTSALLVSVSRAKNIYVSAMLAQGAAMFPLVALPTLYAPELLGVWVGGDFARNSAEVLRWLALGVFINSFARMPFALLQGNGRPDLTAKLHLFELPIYVIVLWWLVLMWGPQGAAIAWTGRIAFDTVMLFVLAATRVRNIAIVQYGSLIGVVVTSGSLIAAWAVEVPSHKAVLAGLALCGSALFLVRMRRTISLHPMESIRNTG